MKIPTTSWRCWRGLVLSVVAAWGSRAVADSPQAPVIPLDGQVLTLEAALRECVRNAPALRAAWEGVEQARADARTAGLLPNPELEVGVSLIPFPGRPFTEEVPGGPTQLEVGLALPVDDFLFGKRSARLASARLGVEVAKADFDEAVRQYVGEVAQAYLDLVEAEALLTLANEDLDHLRKVEEATHHRVKLGGAAESESDRARLAMLDSARALRVQQAAVKTARSQLKALLGRTESSSPLVVEPLREVAVAPEPPGLAQVLALALEQRPDHRSLRLQSERATADIHTEETRALPPLTPSLVVTRQFQKPIGGVDVWSYGVAVGTSLPFFDRNQGNLRRVLSARTQVEQTRAAALAKLRAEVEQAHQALQLAQAQVELVGRDQLAVAASLRDRTRVAFAAGGRSLLDVLDAQRAYRDTYRGVIDGWLSYARAVQQLDTTLGRQVLP